MRLNDRHKHHSHGAQTMDFYVFQSGLRDWNSTYKVVSALLILISCIAFNDVWISLTVIVTMGMVNVIGNRVPLKLYMGLLKIPIVFLVLGCTAIGLGVSMHPAGDYRISLGRIYIYTTAAGLQQAAELFLKAMGAVSAMYAMTLSTSASGLIGVLKKAHMPKLMIELMYLIYRFIFILWDTHGKLKTAAVSRLGYVDFKTACLSFGKTAGNLFLLSMKKADTYYDAMVSRGYDGELRFLEEEQIATTEQIAGIAAYFLGLAIIWYMGRG